MVLFGLKRSTRVHPVGEIIEEVSELLGILKGQVQILAERGVAFEKGPCKKLEYVSRANKNIKELRDAFRLNPRNPILLQKIRDAPDVFEIRDNRDATPCSCSSCTLADQYDFKNQASAIEEFFQKYNMMNDTQHVCMFLPKFHPELNFI